MKFRLEFLCCVYDYRPLCRVQAALQTVTDTVVTNSYNTVANRRNGSQ